MRGLNQEALAISTHAPLAGRDRLAVLYAIRDQHFNPRAPCGARPPVQNAAWPKAEFQPTRPLRGATNTPWSNVFRETFQPTRPLRGATVGGAFKQPAILISTHAPLAGRDVFADELQMKLQIFQPTRPLRGATNNRQMIFALHFISTHAPLAGRDQHIGNPYQPVLISTHAPLAGRDEVVVESSS